MDGGRMKDLTEVRLEVAGRAEYICEHCEEVVGINEGELAHVIPQRKHMITKYGKAVIHNVNNLRWTHPGKCNDAVSVGNNPKQTDEIARLIRQDIYARAMFQIEMHPEWYADVINKLSEVADGEL
jgi:hypothetical protein